MNTYLLEWLVGKGYWREKKVKKENVKEKALKKEKMECMESGRVAGGGVEREGKRKIKVS